MRISDWSSDVCSSDRAAVRWRDSPLASMPILHRGMIVSLWLAALAGGIVPLLWVSIIQRVMTFTADDQTIDGQILGASLITLFAYVGGVFLASAVSWLSWIPTLDRKSTSLNSRH